MEKIAWLRQRYRGFPDAVIHCFQYDYDTSVMEVEIECMRFDLDVEGNHTPWERVRLKLLQVKACRFDEPWNRTNQVLNDVTYLFEEEYYHFDFSSYEESALKEIQESSTFYVMSKDFSLEVIKNLD